MKILTVKNDVVTIRLDSGRIVIVKEEELLINNGTYVDKCKVGYDDAEIMSITLKTIFSDVLNELTHLRREVQYQKHPR
jgi:hypothetical protein